MRPKIIPAATTAAVIMSGSVAACVISALLHSRKGNPDDANQEAIGFEIALNRGEDKRPDQQGEQDDGGR